MLSVAIRLNPSWPYTMVGKPPTAQVVVLPIASRPMVVGASAFVPVIQSSVLPIVQVTPPPAEVRLPLASYTKLPVPLSAVIEETRDRSS